MSNFLFLSEESRNLTIWREGTIRPFYEGAGVNEVSTRIHDALRDRVQGTEFPCVGAKSAFNRSAYAVGVYNSMSTPEATASLHHDLSQFFKFGREEQCRTKELFVTFIAVYPDEQVKDEKDFHHALWRQLQLLHEKDKENYAWDPRVESDVESDNFSYSLGGSAFFIVGMNPHSSRLSRQFNWPALVFNPGPQFEKIRELGIHEKMKDAIRRRDIALQGNINPTLADFGHGNVALTYSGMNTSDISQCPFHASFSKK